jgi:hypothetical protein
MPRIGAAKPMNLFIIVPAGVAVPPGRDCLSYDEGGTDCSFTSYAQCLATASGIGAECYGDTFRDDEAARNRGWAGGSRAPGF